MTYLEVKNMFNILDDENKLEVLIDLGKNLEKIPNKIQGTEIKGCSSRVIIYKDYNRFYGLADSKIVAGVLYIILLIVNENIKIKSQEIKEKIDNLNINLTMNRINGINSIINYFNNIK